MEVQSILFMKSDWTLKDCKKWLKEHKFSKSKVDETDDYYRFRQKNPDLFFEDSFRTIINKENHMAFIIALPQKKSNKSLIKIFS